MYTGKQLEFLKKSHYLQGDETVKDRIDSIIDVVKSYESQYSLGLAERIRFAIENKIIIPSTPQLGNLGRKVSKGTTPLPCSCNIVSVSNSINGIGYSYAETAMLSKLGAGVGVNMENLVEEGTEVADNFYANSRLDWAEDIVGVARKVSQDMIRQGYGVPFFNIESKELPTLLERISRNNPYKSDPFINNNIGVNVSDEFIRKVRGGDKESRKLFLEVLKLRKDTGKVYIVYTGNMCNNISEVYEKLDLKPTLSNICVEISTPHFDDMTFACILTSLNLAKWDYIKENPQIIEDAYMFLDISVSEYIRLTAGVPFLEKARKSAMMKRDIGLGTLGFHDYIQSKGCAFGDVQSRIINREIYSTIRKYADKMNVELAEKLGACQLSKNAGLKLRNVSTMMVAPNKSTAFLAGEIGASPDGLSAGINPITANIFTLDLKGITTTYKNVRLIDLLKKLGKDTQEVWDSITENLGSVQHLDFLSKQEKDVFKTASEISPKDIIDLASDRQKYIDMAQSINLTNRPNYTMQDIYDIHMYAYDKGIKTLYYLYPQAHANVEKSGEKWNSCASCED